MPSKEHSTATERLLAMWDTLALEVGRAVLILIAMVAAVGVFSLPSNPNTAETSHSEKLEELIRDVESVARDLDDAELEDHLRQSAWRIREWRSVSEEESVRRQPECERSQ